LPGRPPPAARRSHPLPDPLSPNTHMRHRHTIHLPPLHLAWRAPCILQRLRAGKRRRSMTAAPVGDTAPRRYCSAACAADYRTACYKLPHSPGGDSSSIRMALGHTISSDCVGSFAYYTSAAHTGACYTTGVTTFHAVALLPLLFPPVKGTVDNVAGRTAPPPPLPRRWTPRLHVVQNSPPIGYGRAIVRHHQALTYRQDYFLGRL